MERNKLDPGQIYGYAVCLVAVLTFIFGAGDLVRGILDLRELPYSEVYEEGPSLVSLGAYRVDVLSRLEFRDQAGAVESLLPADSDFPQMFERERLYRLALSHQRNRTRVMVNLTLLGVALVLFISHWTWLRRRERTGPSKADRDAA